MPNNQQTGDEIREDQLPSFFVNPLGERVALSLAEDAGLDAEDIYEILVGTYADGTSASAPCKKSGNAPHENSVLYYLRTKFDLKALE